MSSNYTIPKLRSLTQGHKTSRHKDVRYATKTSVMPRRHQVMPQRHQICYEDINYATKASIRHKDRVPRYHCHKDCSIWLGNHMSRPKGKNINSSRFT